MKEAVQELVHIRSIVWCTEYNIGTSDFRSMRASLNRVCLTLLAVRTRSLEICKMNWI